jgi:hypothetical protein
MKKIVVLIGYTNEHINTLINESVSNEFAGFEGVVNENNKSLKIELNDDEKLIFQFYVESDNDNVNLDGEVINRIINPGPEWEGTPILEFEYNGEKYEVVVDHIDGH